MRFFFHTVITLSGIAFITLVIILSVGQARAATLVIDNGFESGNLTGLTCSGNCPAVVNTPVATAKFAGNFDLTRSMSTPFRTEVQVPANKGRFLFGEEYWLGLSYRYDDWNKDSSADIAPFQIHTTPSTWSNPACGTGSAMDTAPFLMATQHDGVRFVTYGGKTLWRGPVEKKQWLNIVVHFKISTGADGYIEVWKDGVKLGQVEGANSQALDGCKKPIKEPYFKMGVYKWDWKKGRPATQSTRRQLFIDDLKIARGSDGYSLVGGTPLVPVDKTPPVLTQVNHAVTDHEASITWSSQEPANGPATLHVIDLKSLPANTEFRYRITASDRAGNVVESGELSFTTLPSAEVPE